LTSYDYVGTVFLPKNTFSGLPSLVSLRLGRNMIDRVESGAFDGLTNLRHLDLSANRFEQFDLSVFATADLTNLMVLDLRNYYLEKLDATTSISSRTNSSQQDIATSLFSKCRNKVLVKLYNQYNDYILETLVERGLIILKHYNSD
jgi:hypothetical protein